MQNPGNAAEMLVVDVGNSRVKLGHFPTGGDCGASPASALPIAPPPLLEPNETLAATIEEIESGVLASWLEQLASPRAQVVLGSVSRPMADRFLVCLEGWFADCQAELEVDVLHSDAMPIEVNVEHPDRVGIDRLAAAVAANQLRRPGVPAIVVDVGTAVTVDLISAYGVFEGGAILPGVRMAAEALHERTDALPSSDLAVLEEAPDAVGKETLAAIQAGLFWGAVGAIRELIDRQRDGLSQAPQVFLSGGAAPSVARLIGGPDYTVRYVEHLTLAGLVQAARAKDGD